MPGTQLCMLDTQAARARGEGRIVQLPERGSFFVRTSDGPAAAPAVVLLHGLGATADLNWSTTIPALSRTCRVAAPDVRGHGRAATPDGFTLEDAADDVAALADALSLPPFIVVGYSMGGAIAQLVCKRHPEKVRGLVLCATSRSFIGTWRERLLLAAIQPVRVATRAIPDEVARATARRIAERLVGARPDNNLDDCLQTVDVGRVLEAACALGNFRSEGWIGTLDLPSAVVVHLRDQIVPMSRQFELAHALPQAVVHPIDSDHSAPLTNSHRFASTLVDAVRDVHRRAESPTSVVRGRAQEADEGLVSEWGPDSCG